MKTKSGQWEIVNATRYNTEDIVAVFNGFEDMLTRLTQGHKPDRDREEGLIRFSDFSPMNPTYNTNRGEVRVWVRGASYTCKHLRDVGLLKPNKLYDNPVQALSAPRLEGKEQVPSGFVAAMVTHIVAPAYVNGISYAGLFDATKYPIRIEPRKAAKIDGPNMYGNKLFTLTKEHQDVNWKVMSLCNHIEGLRRKVKEVQPRFDKLNLRNTLRLEDIEEAEKVIETLRQKLIADLNMLTKERS